MITASATAPLFIGHEIYRHSSYGDRHPLRVPRVSTVTDLARAMGWLPDAAFRRSPRARPEALTIWHTPAYIAALQEAEASGPAPHLRAFGLGTVSNPVFPEVWRRPATSAGGVMLAAALLRDGGVIYAPAGGTHHGLPDRANGFCYLNDPVLAMLTMRQLGIRRIAYVDIDAHHCDGVDVAFRNDPDILLVSVHEEARWPFTGALTDQGGAGTVFNMPVPRGLNDSEMDAILCEVILPRVENFAPQAVVLQCGADAVEEDPLSRLSLSNNAHRRVVAALRPLSPRYLVLGGGGYNPWSVGRCWAGVWATLAGAEIPDRLPPEAEAVLSALVWHDAPRSRPVQPHWFTTIADPPRPGPVRPEIRDRIAVLAARGGGG